MPSVLDVSGLRITFHEKDGTAFRLQDINFSLNKGECLGILGESGSGKSLCCLSIMGLLPPQAIIQSGKISFHSKAQSEDLLSLSQAKLRGIRGKRISMIFQEPMSSLNPVMRCGKQITEAIIHHTGMASGLAKSRAYELLEEVMLPDPGRIFNAYPHEISGGQKQRVMIAMALSCNPDILIADEPTTALDVTVQKRILELLEELQAKYEMAMIFISHDLGVISRIADSCLVMYQGKLVESGPVSKLFSKPEHPYTKGLIACRPNINTKMHTLPTIGDFISNKKPDKKTFSLEKFLLSKEEVSLRKDKIAASKTLIATQGLTTCFYEKSKKHSESKGWFKAVDQVSINVKKGETLGLVGESGSGKTSLGRTIVRLIDSQQGAVFFDGVNISNLKQKEFKKFRKRLQIIFQDPYSSLNPRMTVGEALMEPLKIHNICKSKSQRRERALELMKTVNLEKKYLKRYPHEFSGGQRQRICIARALAVNPDFIICDECVSALDVSVQAQILNLLNELKEKFNLTYIFISHDLSVVKFMADRIAVMKNGKILETKNTDDLFKSPDTHYTKELIDSIP